MHYILILRIIILAALWNFSRGQNCFGGIETFEKTTGTAFGPSVGSSVLLQQQDQALTRDCVNLCKQQSQCLAFSLDYAGFRCGAYTVNSVGRRDVLEAKLNSNYFEKTCFHGVQKSHFENLCGDKLWAFERVKDAFLNGYVEKETQNVQTKEECERLCLTETSFTCRSADFDEIMKVCRMSKEDRRSQPQAFREVVGSNRDYLENQCAASAPTSCRYDIRPGLSVISMDALQFASSSDDCQIQCDSETTFNCRAYTYTNNRCFLSGDDSVSLGPVVLPERPGATYGEKKCVIEQCTGGAFTYEKMTGFVLRSAVLNSIIVSNPGSLGNTLECQEYCQRDGLDCPAFSVNYQNMRCDKLDRNSQGRTQDLVPRDGENYFEKICLRGPVATSCKNKAWAFERILGHELEPQLYDRTVPFVQSRRDCEELCLEERIFTCRSALYNDDTTECKLSREDRRTLPAFYRRTNNMKVNYLENHCLPVLTSCPYEETADSYPTYTDHIQMVGITSSEVCEQFCTNYQKFNCRSYAYYSSNGQCFLSGDDRASGGAGAVQNRPGLIYNERKCPALTPPTDTPTTPTTEMPAPTRQCSPGEVMMLEKTTGYQHLGSTSILYRGNPDIPGITTECKRMCELNYECRGFTLDYLKQECYSGVETSSTSPKDLVIADNKAYFEGVCLPFFLGCSKQWMFDRYVDKELRGVQPRDVIRMVSRTDCERRCLEERRFVCRSANYYHFNQECRLYAEEKTIPHTQLSYANGIDYLENQCNIGTATCPHRIPERDMFMVYATKAIPAISNFELCRQLCVKELDFNCRSYTYLEQGGLNDLCLLSPESRQTGHANSIRYRLRSLYQETECRGQIPGTTTTTTTPSTRPSQGTLPPLEPPPPPPVKTPPPPHPPLPIPPPPARCTFEQYTYEKVMGFNARFGRKERVPTRATVGILAECQSNCQKLGERCRGFMIEYTKFQQICFWFDAYSSGVDSTLVPNPDAAYFEKVCLSETCGKLWSFERIPGHAFHEIPLHEIPGVPKRTDCEEICIRHHPPCKSATYDSFRRICRIFKETRRSSPGAFTVDLPEMEYLENQCAFQPATCDYHELPDRFFPYIDKLTRAYNLADCRRQCDIEDKFLCRSFNYETVVRDCALSSEDGESVGADLLLPRPNSVYSEKGNCEQVSVQCNQQDMLLTVNFGMPFHGRVYAKGNPTQCYMIGTGQTTLLFAISLGSRCGTVLEGSGRYSNEVVVQEHPVIVTNSDKNIKVVCSFETLDRTVTLGTLYPGASAGVDVTTRFQVPITAIVTNTAPPPNVAMRVLDRTGRDAGVVGLGDDLMLRIELKDPSSSLAIFARNLYARSKNGESLFLIDSTGCPTDPTIFPALSLDARDRKSLFANFKAFRFPSTGLVNFEVQIRFCQEQCKPVRCANNMESYGRKKRSIENDFSQDDSERFTSTSTPSGYAAKDPVQNDIINHVASTALETQLQEEHRSSETNTTKSLTHPENNISGEMVVKQHTFQNASSTGMQHPTQSPQQPPPPLPHSYRHLPPTIERTFATPFGYYLTTASHLIPPLTPRVTAKPGLSKPAPQNYESKEAWKIHLPRNPQHDPNTYPHSFAHQIRSNYVSLHGNNRTDWNSSAAGYRPNDQRWNQRNTIQNNGLPRSFHSQSPNHNVIAMPAAVNGRSPSELHNRHWDRNVRWPLTNHAWNHLISKSNQTAQAFGNYWNQNSVYANLTAPGRNHNWNWRFPHPNRTANDWSAQRNQHFHMFNRNASSVNDHSLHPLHNPYNNRQSNSFLAPNAVRGREAPRHDFRTKPDAGRHNTRTSPPPSSMLYRTSHMKNHAFQNGSTTHGRSQGFASAERWTSYTGSPANRVRDTADTPAKMTTPEMVVSTMVPVPEDVPLSLAIMVGEDSGVDINAWNPGSGDTFDAVPTDYAGLVCMTITTVAATAVALSLAHVGGIVGAFCCYRWYKKSKRRKLMQESFDVPRPEASRLTRRLANSGQEGVFYAKPDVSFRNVYGSYESPP